MTAKAKKKVCKKVARGVYRVLHFLAFLGTFKASVFVSKSEHVFLKKHVLSHSETCFFLHKHVLLPKKI